MNVVATFYNIPPMKLLQIYPFQMSFIYSLPAKKTQEQRQNFLLMVYNINEVELETSPKVKILQKENKH